MLSALNATGVRYLVVGGVAVVLHGHLRTTADLDLVVSLEPAWARGVTVSLEATTATVVALQDLLALKREARRPQDLAFLRMYRSLDTLLGDAESCRRWLHAENRHLGQIPARLIASVEGLVHVTQYLDALRGKN